MPDTITLVYIGPLDEVETYVPTSETEADDIDAEERWVSVPRGGTIELPTWRAERMLEQVDNWQRKGKAPAAKKAPAKKAAKRPAKKAAAKPSVPPADTTDPITDPEGDPR